MLKMRMPRSARGWWRNRKLKSHADHKEKLPNAWYQGRININSDGKNRPDELVI